MPGVCESACQPGNDTQYEPARQSLRQRQLRELHAHPQAGRDLHQHLSRYGGSRAHIEEFIERYYNRIRLHSALGYLPPEEFEQRRGQRSIRPGGQLCGCKHELFQASGNLSMGSETRSRSVGSRIASTPRPILSMSLQPAIPWRVSLQQSPTPLHRLSTTFKEKLHLEKTITLNSNCVFGKMSHSRGSPRHRSKKSELTPATRQQSPAPP